MRPSIKRGQYMVRHRALRHRRRGRCRLHEGLSILYQGKTYRCHREPDSPGQVPVQLQIRRRKDLPSRGSARYKSETHSRLGEALAGFIRRTASKERLPILSDTTDSGGRRNCSERDNGEKQFARRYCVRKNCAERDWQLRYGASYCAFSSYFYWFAPLLPGVISLFIMENLRKNMVR